MQLIVAIFSLVELLWDLGDAILEFVVGSSGLGIIKKGRLNNYS